MSPAKSYFKTTISVMLRNKLSSTINVAGLSVGFSGCLLIALFILEELKFDRHFSHVDRLYRITSHFTKNGKSHSSARTPGALGPMLVSQILDVQLITRMIVPDEGFLFSGMEAFKETIVFTDSTFLQVFGIQLMIGNPSTCLANPSSMILSESMAEKLYGRHWRDREILGETLSIDGRIPMVVTAVFKDLAAQTHFHSSIFATVPQDQADWIEKDEVFTYVLLRENSSGSHVAQKLSTFEFDRSDASKEVWYGMQHISDIHLMSSLAEDLPTGSMISIVALALIAVFLLVTSVINFVNLYTAQTLERFKEVGVRQVLGAMRKQLAVQFMMETSFVVIVVICLSLAIACSILPMFNDLTSKHFTVSNIFEGQLILITVGMGLLVVIVAGTYPAIYLSSKKPMETLKGKLASDGAQRFKNALLTFQFTISTIMIILTWIALQQIKYIHNKPLGFDKDPILVLRNPYMIGNLERIKTFRDALLQLAGVEHVSISGYTPAQKRWEKFRMTFSADDQKFPVAANWILADEGFLKTMGIALTEGRNFSENHSLDSHAIVINEKAAELLHLRKRGANAVGKELYYEDEHGGVEKFQVIGVVQDFNFASLHDEIKPVVLQLGYHRFEMALRLADVTSVSTISAIQGLWKKFVPSVPFEYDFMHDRFNKLHRADEIVGKLFSICGGLTIFVASMGLFCMISQAIMQRTKEIGIRKALGASEGSLVWLLSARFLKRVLVASLMACPIAWMLASMWLENFAFKTEITWWAFAGTTGIMVTMAFATLIYKVLGTVLTTPVKYLRHE